MAKKKKTNKNTVEIKSYKETMADLEEVAIKKIQQYLTDNKITYSCNTEDFIIGLVLGLQVGSEVAYTKLTGTVIEYNSESSINLHKFIQDLKNQ